jgi:hypothetical protein
LLEAWEYAEARPTAERLAALLSALDQELAPAAGVELPLGVRDARLLAWREQTFGYWLNCLADCPKCQTRVEFSVHTRELSPSASASPEALSLECDGWKLVFRLPNTADFSAAANEGNPASARLCLFARCLVSAISATGAEAGADAVPDELVRAVGERMADAAPLTDLSFALCCPNCGVEWEAPFDVAGFFWQELRAWAARLLRDVHELASAYHWNETEILSLPSARRRAYLELIRS